MFKIRSGLWDSQKLVTIMDMFLPLKEGEEISSSTNKMILYLVGEMQSQHHTNPIPIETKSVNFSAAPWKS